MNIAMYQPDIPQNVGAMIRLCACLNFGLSIIKPCGFPWDEKRIKTSAMDYINHIEINKFESWEHFLEGHKDSRIILLTTKSSDSYTKFSFQNNDVLLVGRESAGVPENVHNFCNHRITIPMNPVARSLNVVNSAAIVAGEAMRQLI